MSELYTLPEGWEWKELQFFGKFIRGVSYKKEQLLESPTNHSFTLLRANNIQNELELDDIQIVPKDVAKGKEIKDGDILFAMSSGSKHLVGKNILLNGLKDYTFGAFCSIYRNQKNDVLNNYYLSYVLKSNLYRDKLSGLSMGANINNLKSSDLEIMKIPLPPLEEQKRIVAKLDNLFAKIDKAIALHQKNIDEANVFMASVLNDVFVELDTNETIELKYITSKIGSGSTPRGGQKAYKTEGITLIRSMNVHDNGFRIKGLAFIDDEQANKLDNVTIKENDILLNITGASVARCCIVDKNYLPARVNQHVSIIRLDDKFIPNFLHYYLISPSVKSDLLFSSSGGATREAITKSMLEEFKVPKISIITQQKVVSYLDEISKKMEKIKQIQKEKMQSLKALKASILDQAFKGEL